MSDETRSDRGTKEGRHRRDDTERETGVFVKMREGCSTAKTDRQTDKQTGQDSEVWERKRD